MKEAFDVLPPQGREDKCAEEGQADLAAVGVAGEHEVDERSARMQEDVVGVVGLVGHEDDGGVGVGGDSEIEVGAASVGVVDAAEPEAFAALLDGNVLVDEDGCAVAGEGFDDERSADGDVVVAEDAVAERGGEGAEDLCAAVGGGAGVNEGESAAGNEVAGEEDEMGIEGVDVVDDALEEVRFGELVEVNVADLDDAVAVEWGWQVGDGNGAVVEADFVAGDLSGVKSEASGCGTGSDEEFASAETRRLIGIRTGHTP